MTDHTNPLKRGLISRWNPDYPPFVIGDVVTMEQDSGPDLTVTAVYWEESLSPIDRENGWPGHWRVVATSERYQKVDGPADTFNTA